MVALQGVPDSDLTGKLLFFWKTGRSGDSLRDGRLRERWSYRRQPEVRLNQSELSYNINVKFPVQYQIELSLLICQF